MREAAELSEPTDQYFAQPLEVSTLNSLILIRIYIRFLTV